MACLLGTQGMPCGHGWWRLSWPPNQRRATLQCQPQTNKGHHWAGFRPVETALSLFGNWALNKPGTGPGGSYLPVLFYIIWQRNFGSQKWMTSKWMTMKLKSPHMQAPSWWSPSKKLVDPTALQLMPKITGLTLRLKGLEAICLSNRHLYMYYKIKLSMGTFPRASRQRLGAMKAIVFVAFV